MISAGGLLQKHIYEWKQHIGFFPTELVVPDALYQRIAEEILSSVAATAESLDAFAKRAPIEYRHAYGSLMIKSEIVLTEAPTDNIMEMLNRIRKGRNLHEICFANSGVAFIYFDPPMGFQMGPHGDTTWRQYLTVEDSYPSLEEAIRGEYQKVCKRKNRLELLPTVAKDESEIN